MTQTDAKSDDQANNDRQRAKSIDWYAEGQSRTVVVVDQEVHIRFVGRRGRRGRIVISAPAGATFRGD